MSEYNQPSPDCQAQLILDYLRQTAAKTLDHKRRLGHYAMIWQNNAPVAVGQDAPINIKSSLQIEI